MGPRDIVFGVKVRTLADCPMTELFRFEKPQCVGWMAVRLVNP